MTKLLLPLALALFVLPAASAASLLSDPMPDSIGHVLDSDSVSIRHTLNPSVEEDDVVPLCDDAPDVPEDQDVLGTVKDGCFQPTQTEGEEVGPLPVLDCSPVGGSILSPTFPHVAVKPDEECINSIPEQVFGLLNDRPKPNVNVGINK